MIFASLLLVAFLLSLGNTQYLDNSPLFFLLGGNVTYTPTSGSVSIPGYSLKISYAKHSWLGVKFMTKTSGGNYDILIFERQATPTSGKYKCSVSDWFVTQIRQESLRADTINNNDKQVFSYSQSNEYTLEVYRTKADMQGQDWQGGDFVEICFFTSSQVFDSNKWTNQFQSCYGYSVNGYVSVFKGVYLSKFQIQGVESLLYGGANQAGNKQQMSLLLFIYRPTSSISVSNITIRLGSSIGSTVGQDYFVCGQGDYFGFSPTELNKDLYFSGFQDGSCNYGVLGTSFQLTYQRNIWTGDQFDQTVTNPLSLCFHFTNIVCIQPQVKYLFPRLSVASALKIYSSHTILILNCLMLMILIVIFA